MQTVDQIFSAKWVLPIAPENIVLENHSVIVNKTRIVDILPTKGVAEKYTAKEKIELSHHVLMPGLVNAHTHAAMNLFRSLADDLPLMDWLQEHMWRAEENIINAETITIGTNLALMEMIRGGTLCFNDMYFYAPETAEAVIKAGIRASLGLTILAIPSGEMKTEEDYFKRAYRDYARAPKSDLITWIVMPHAAYTNSDHSLKRCLALADELGLRLHAHANESLGEIEMDKKQHGKSSLQRLDDAGLLNEKMLLAHMVHLTDEEIKLIQERKVHVVHCPESNMKLGSGFADMPRLVNLGINVCLGTDGAASNNDLDMLGEMQSAAFLAKGLHQDPTVFHAPQILRMATLHGAKALGLEKEIGSLEKNKSADMIAVDLSHYFTQPIYNIFSLLVYAVNRFQVSDAWIKGKCLLEKGELKTIDVEKILTELNCWTSEIKRFSA